MALHVYVRQITDTEKIFLASMMEAAQIKEYEIRDLAIKDAETFALESKSTVCIAIGKVCARLVNGHADKCITLPTFKELEPKEQNRVHRENTWALLMKVKELLEGNNIESHGEQWQYAIVHLPDQRVMCIYEKDRPQGVKADIYISQEDSQLLLRIKEAFKAEAVIIREEAG